MCTINLVDDKANNELSTNLKLIVRIKGDHWYHRKEGFQRPTCVPHPKKDLPIGTVKAIERQTGIKFK